MIKIGYICGGVDSILENSYTLFERVHMAVRMSDPTFKFKDSIKELNADQSEGEDE